MDHTPSREAYFEKWIYKAIEKKEEIGKKLIELSKLKAEVMAVIDEVSDDNYRMVLKLRYIESKQFLEIAKSIYVSESTVKRWHRSGLEMVKVPS